MYGYEEWKYREEGIHPLRGIHTPLFSAIYLKRSKIMNIETLTNDMYTAMKNGDTEKKAVLSSLISNIKKMAIDEKCKDNIPETLVYKALHKEVKTIKEQIDTCPANRTDLMDKYKEDFFILNEYVPKQLNRGEIIEILNKDFADVLATKNMGKIMKAVMPELRNKANGRLIQEIVVEFCQ